MAALEVDSLCTPAPLQDRRVGRTPALVRPAAPQRLRRWRQHALDVRRGRTTRWLHKEWRPCTLYRQGGTGTAARSWYRRLAGRRESEVNAQDRRRQDMGRSDCGDVQNACCSDLPWHHCY